MSSTLSEGVRVPDIGSVNWGADVNFNWGLLNTCLANISGNVKVDAENTWTAPQTFTETISGSIDGVAARAVGDEDGNNIKTALAGKQPSLSQSQLDACNSGVTAAAVQQIGTNTADISSLQTAVSGKAADADVVHLAGAETITGNKTWTGLNTYQKRIVLKDAAAVSAGGFGVGLNFYDYEGNGYGYIQPYVTSDGTKNIVFSNSAGGNLQFGSAPVPYSSGAVGLGTNALRWNGIYDANSIFVYNGYTFGTAPSTNRFWGLWCRDNAGLEVVDFLACAYSSGTNSAVLRCLNTDGTNTYDRRLELVVATDGTTQLKPYHNAQYGLGSGTYKWKALNGINPGALSLPSNSVYIDILSSITHTDWTVNYYTPAINGYIALNVNGCAIIQPYGTYGISAGFYDGTVRINDLRVCLPVIANQTYEIWVLGTVNEARLFACLGNV